MGTIQFIKFLSIIGFLVLFNSCGDNTDKSTTPNSVESRSSGSQKGQAL